MTDQTLQDFLARVRALDHLNYRYIALARQHGPVAMNEVSLRRVWREFRDRPPTNFALIGTWIGEPPCHGASAWDVRERLEHDIKSRGYGVERLFGLWRPPLVEGADLAEGEPRYWREPSLAVLNIPLAILRRLMAKWQQPGTILVSEEVGGVAVVRSDEEEVEDLGPFDPAAIAQAWERTRGLGLTFEAWRYPPQGWMQGMIEMVVRRREAEPTEGG